MNDKRLIVVRGLRDRWLVVDVREQYVICETYSHIEADTIADLMEEAYAK